MKKKESFFDKVKSFSKQYILTGAMILSSMSFTAKEADPEAKDSDSQGYAKKI